MGLPEGWYGDLLERRPDDTDDTHIARKRAVMQVDIARVKAARAALEAAAASPAAGGTDRAKGDAAPDPQRRAAEVAQAVLWLAANNAGLPAAALVGLGLDTAAMAQFEQQHSRDLTELRLLQATARHMSRAMVGRLLVGRLTGQALTAQTPQDMAAVTRAFRSLPDWAWEEEGESPTAKGESEDGGRGEDEEGKVQSLKSNAQSGKRGNGAGPASTRGQEAPLPDGRTVIMRDGEPPDLEKIRQLEGRICLGTVDSLRESIAARDRAEEDAPMNRAARRRLEKAEREKG
jgi:hypothetical protein